MEKRLKHTRVVLTNAGSLRRLMLRNSRYGVYLTNVYLLSSSQKRELINVILSIFDNKYPRESYSYRRERIENRAQSVLAGSSLRYVQIQGGGVSSWGWMRSSWGRYRLVGGERTPLFTPEWRKMWKND